ncbi:PREDICTED: histone-lysine N-methyltransferase SETMAR-like, partial [Trachymyrmex septentrionalis]|uniref:histone-lysine N-methyltransferase SETMAR-like n=1 Tax=Trachymyrmex septentrionalis TaxID=34720 RepID=UPI00084F02B6
RYVIQYFHLKGLSPTNIKAELDSTLEESAPSFTTVKYWVAEFKRGHTSCEDEHRSGRPSEAIPEMVKKIHKMVLGDRQLKVRELADMINISKSAVHRILAENLEMRKLCARWVPRLLTVEQKQRREDVPIECLAMIRSNKAEFLRRFITMDETWVHHFTPETKEQSKQWTEKGELASKKAKTVLSAGKVMASVFWDARGIIFIDYLQKGRTINGEYYANLLQRLGDEIKEKRPHLAKKKVLFHQNNAPVHTSIIAMAKINELKTMVMNKNNGGFPLQSMGIKSWFPHKDSTEDPGERQAKDSHSFLAPERSNRRRRKGDSGPNLKKRRNTGTEKE